MAILKPGGKFTPIPPPEGQFQLQNPPAPHSGAFTISHKGTVAYDPDQQKMEPIESEGPKKKRDMRPKNWYDEQCKLENHTRGMLLGRQTLNSARKGDERK
jgi:hypothetical protein